MPKLSQKGFSAVEVILVLVIVSIIGFVGWFVYNSQKSTDKTFSDANKSQSAKIITKSPASQTDTKSYMLIKEWGVKIPLSSATIGSYYKVSANIEQSSTNPINLTVYSKQADALVGPAGISCEGEYIGYLMRLKTSDPSWQPSKSVDDGNVSPLFSERIDVGEYRYALATKKGYGPECWVVTKDGDYDSDTATAQKFQNLVEAFTNDFKNIQSE